MYVDGFRPVQGARGPTSGVRFDSPKNSRLNTRSASGGFGHGGGFSAGFADSLDFQGSVHGGFGGGDFGGDIHSGGGGAVAAETLGEPDKTIYVRLPQGNKGHRTQPKSAGPPQKHYRIVIIRSPTPAPVQPVIPPRTEQKTIIYVLHQKPKVAQTEVLETPVVKHPPQVLFVGYDDELSASDLKQLAEGNHEGFSVTSQQEPVIDGSAGVGGYSENQVSGGGFSGSGFGHNFESSFGSQLSGFHGNSGLGGGGLPGFSYNQRRSAPAPPGRVSSGSKS